MCTTTIETHLCGIRIRNRNRTDADADADAAAADAEEPPSSCAASAEADELAKTLDPSGIIRSGLREKEIARLRKACRDGTYERHRLSYFLKCEACVREFARLEKEAVEGDVPEAL